ALLIDCLKLRAQHAPLLLVLEDAHWLDPLSQDLLEAVTRAIRKQPVLVVLTYRPSEHFQLQARDLPYFTELLLEPLAPDAAEALLHACWQRGGGSELSPDIVQQLLARTYGNPFYLEELARYLLAQPTHKELTLSLPASLESLILSRLDQIPEHERLALRVASIIGRRFPALWVGGYYPALGKQDEVEHILDELTASTLLATDTTEPEPAYQFRQALTQEVTYTSLPHATRARLHEQLAHYLEVQEGDTPVMLLAHHYQASENLSKKREYLRRAGELSQAAYANGAARAYYETVLPLLTESSEQIDVGLKLGAVLEVMGEWGAAEGRYQEVLDLATQSGTVASLAQAEQALGNLLEKQGNYDAAWHWLKQAQARWEQVGDASGRGAVLASLGVVARRQGQKAVAQAVLTESLQLCRDGADLAGQALALDHLGALAYEQGLYAEARGYHAESLALWRTVGDRRGLARTLNNLANVAYDQGDYDEARALHEESLVLRRAIGDKLGIAHSLNNLANIASSQEAYGEARGLYEGCLALVRDLGNRQGEAFVLGNLGLAAYAQQAYADSQDYHEESLALARAMGDPRGVAYSLENLGLVAYARGAYAEARGFLAESLRLNQSSGGRQTFAYPLLVVAALIQAGGAAGGDGQATRLLGTVAALLTETGRHLESVYQAPYEAVLATLHEQLGPDSFERCLEEGQRMSLEDSVSLALTSLLT
ncbi:MAG: tetratricopeptide repeat protein, partial [Ardenticatenales bacterium]|nr:tetratricopeptide repeat protein [Ardenticatenales bacterium]